MNTRSSLSRRKVFRALGGVACMLAATTIPATEALAGFAMSNIARAAARKSAEIEFTRKVVFFLGGAGTAAQQQAYGIFNVKASPYNAVGNVVMVDGSMSSSSSPTHLSSVGGAYTAGDVGKTICVSGAGASGAPLVTTIASVTNSTNIILNASCLTTTTTAIVQYGTDDTAAFQATVNAIFAAGGGVCYAPAGTYMIAGSFGGPGTQNAQIYLPFIANLNRQVSITFIGATHPVPPVPGNTVLSDNIPVTTGSILFSPVNGSGTSPCIIGAGPTNTAGLSPFSLVMATVANMTIRTAWKNPNPLIGLQFGSCSSAHIEAVYFDTDETSNTMAASAPVANSTAYMGPSINNCAYNVVRDCWATGYDVGFSWSEHGFMDYVQVFLCNIAFQVYGAYHAIHATRIAMYSSKVGIKCLGTVYLNIMQYDAEHNNSTGAWFNTPTDIVDASNFLHGTLNYLIVRSSFGVDQSNFTKSGGTNITCTAL